MEFVEAFDTFEDAESCALSFFDDCHKQCLSPGNYIYLSHKDPFQMWVYVEDEVWYVIHCAPNSWRI